LRHIETDLGDNYEYFVVIQNSITDLATPNNPAKLQLLESLLEAEAVSGPDLLSTAFMAAKNGALDILELLLDYVFPLSASGSYFCAAEVDEKNSKIRSPSHRSRDILEMAVIGGHLEVVEFLLQEEQWYQKEQGDNKLLFDKKMR